MSLNHYNDEEFIYRARYQRLDFLNPEQKLYMEQRLKSLGYDIEYGCCGANILRYNNERQSHISTNE